MADFGQDAVIACCSLAAGFGAATILNERKKVQGSQEQVV